MGDIDMVALAEASSALITSSLYQADYSRKSDRQRTSATRHQGGSPA
jgi:hypothetical protein